MRGGLKAIIHPQLGQCHRQRLRRTLLERTAPESMRQLGKQLLAYLSGGGRTFCQQAQKAKDECRTIDSVRPVRGSCLRQCLLPALYGRKRRILWKDAGPVARQRRPFGHRGSSLAFGTVGRCGGSSAGFVVTALNAASATSREVVVLRVLSADILFMSFRALGYPPRGLRT